MTAVNRVVKINSSSCDFWRVLLASVFRHGSPSSFVSAELSLTVILLCNSSAENISHSVVTTFVNNLVGDVFISISRRKVLSSFCGRNKLTATRQASIIQTTSGGIIFNEKGVNSRWLTRANSLRIAEPSDRSFSFSLSYSLQQFRVSIILSFSQICYLRYFLHRIVKFIKSAVVHVVHVSLIKNRLVFLSREKGGNSLAFLFSGDVLLKQRHFVCPTGWVRESFSVST